MYMPIHNTLKAGIPDALRAKDTARLTTLRSLVTAMTNEVIAKKRKPDQFLTDEEALVILKRAANQRKDSIEQFEKADRNDLADTEKAELIVIQSFLPTQMPREEIEKHARAKMTEMSLSQKADAGRLIGALMKDFKGTADGNDVKAVVDTLLA